MKSLCIYALAIAASALSGCGEKTLSKVFIESNDKPTIYLGAGTVVLISEGDTAEVYGPDQCPKSGNEWLFGPTVETSGCTLLSGMDAVNVRLLLPDGSVLNEIWSVAEGVGPNGSGVQVVRPNGWIPREPTSRKL